MTKNEFLSQLERRLSALPENERNDAIEYYSGYLDDAGEDEAKAIEHLGSPAEVAANIFAEYAVSDTRTPDDTEPERERKFTLPIAWTVILAIFAVPIGLPLAIAVAVVAIALLAVIFSLAVAFGATAFGLVVGGAAGVVVSLIALFQNVPLALMMLGSTLVVLGLGIMFMKLTVTISKSGFSSISRFVGNVIMRRVKK
ncbi:MAG: DUF1700 domain-containing protein [Oscillospiraceae bacterium]|nr:DUF1700 domain-containing protein [Oscillospiraceae bacterium]